MYFAMPFPLFRIESLTQYTLSPTDSIWWNVNVLHALKHLLQSYSHSGQISRENCDINIRPHTRLDFIISFHIRYFICTSTTPTRVVWLAVYNFSITIVRTRQLGHSISNETIESEKERVLSLFPTLRGKIKFEIDKHLTEQLENISNCFVCKLYA